MKNEIGTLIKEENDLLDIINELKVNDTITNELIESFAKGRRFLSIFADNLVLFSSNFNFNLVSNDEFCQHMDKKLTRVVSNLGVNKEVFYIDSSGKRQGIYEAFRKYDNSLAQRLHYIDGKKNGESYEVTHITIIESSYIDDKLDGIKKTSTKAGVIQEELIYKDGLLDGTSKFYDKGKLSHGMIYEKGVLIDKVQFNEDGSIYIKYTVDMFVDEFLT